MKIWNRIKGHGGDFSRSNFHLKGVPESRHWENREKELLIEKFWASFYLIFPTMQWGTQRRWERGFCRSPLLGRGSAPRSAWLQSWAHAKTRRLLPTSLHGRTVSPGVGHGILICVPWKGFCCKHIWELLAEAVWWIDGLFIFWKRCGG